MHFQEPHAQGKLVQVVSGAVFDVAADVRRGSPTFGRWVGFELNADNKRQLWVPPGFAHGFLVLSDVADFFYKCTALYRPEAERALAWNDPELAIHWPIAEPLLSPKDAAAPRLADAPVLPRFDASQSGG
jgi:dTDP-4-dehydrorhamnose 3,5-epimerase